MKWFKHWEMSVICFVIAKGQFEVELDDDLTADRPLKAGTQLSFTGEVDHDDGRSVVDVKKVHSVKGTTTNSPSATISN